MFSTTNPRPTRARYLVVAFALALAVIQYVDRVCISEVAPAVTKEFGLSKEQMGWVFGAFTLAYALFEIPIGYLGDVSGPRRVLVRVVLWWSFFTIASGFVWSWGSLVITRFLFGVGEAGCFPNLTKAFERWLPPQDRIRAQAILWTSARWAGAATPSLVFFVLGFVNWRVVFMLFGAVGFVWAAIFHSWYRDNPREHSAVNAAEIALLPISAPSDRLKAPWSRIARSKSVWLLCGQYFASTYSVYFLITWFPTYLLEVHHFDLKKSALLAGLPMFFGGTGSMLAGWITPHLQRWVGSTGLARRLIGIGGAIGAASCLVLATLMQNPIFAVAGIALASLLNDVTLPAAWTTSMDIGGAYVGTVSGTMNMMGNLGGFVSPIALGYIVGNTGNWALTFYVTAGLHLFGAICWWLLDPITPFHGPIKPGQPVAATA
jgi:ACS family glucarate transporter-like MFS transporter